MSVAAVVASTCCCEPSNCGCPQYPQLVVAWTGSLTLAGDCPSGCDTGTDHLATVTYTDISVPVLRQDATGHCSYEGSVVREDAYDLCDDSGSGVVTTQFYATVYYNAIMTRWEAALYIRTGYDGTYAVAGTGGACNWYSGGAANALASMVGYEPSGNPDYALCPELATYTNVGGSSCIPSAECTGGVDCCGGTHRLEIAAWTTGSLAVS